MITLDILRSALAEAWSIDTSTKLRLENPALGQCSVTALVVQDILGGDILKTRINGGWHFYNRIEGNGLIFPIVSFLRH